MVIRRISLAVVLLGLACGCGGNRGPVVVHYKPVSYWLEQRKSTDIRTRRRAVASLCLAGKVDPAARTAVIEAVKDPDSTVRDTAVLGLLRMGRAADGAVAALREAQSDSDPVVREHATKALERIEGRAK
jgi:HEAT repeat protein